MKNTKYFVYASILVIICLIFAMIMVKMGGWSSEKNPEVIGIVAAIVAVSTISSLAFALVIYVESVFFTKSLQAIRAEIDEKKREVEDVQAKAMQDLTAFKENTRELAMACVKGLTVSFMSLPPINEYTEVMKNLKDAEMSVNLSSGTAQGLRIAVEEMYKRDYRRFLDSESLLWEKTTALEPTTRDELRQYYLKLKEQALDGLTRHRGV